jgi:hypothetical protein
MSAPMTPEEVREAREDEWLIQRGRIPEWAAPHRNPANTQFPRNEDGR